MSLSVADMLKSLGAQSSQMAPAGRSQGKLLNPDIPERGDPISGREIVRDRFHTSMKQPTSARNGAGYSLARTGGIPNMNPRRQEFMLEGAIDPANIRARHDPTRAPPNSYAQGAEGFGYTLPTGPPRNSVDLIKRARTSYAARLNRLQPDAPPGAATPAT